jgi:glucan biosynthesis protein C
LFCPLLYLLKRNENSKAMCVIKAMFSHPLSLVVVVGAFIAEARIIKPVPYEMYAMTWHGFFLGLLAFFFGFCFMLMGATFWKMLQTWRWLFLALALTGFGFRQFYFGMNTPSYLLVTESQCWILAVLAFGSKHLNRPGSALTYLSQAAYPVYILHMIFLYLGSLLIFRLNIALPIQFVFVLVFTLAGCFLTFELIRRVKYLRPLFGLKM